MRRLLLVVTGFGASLIMVCLLLLNVHGTLAASQVRQAWDQVTLYNAMTQGAATEIQFPYTISGTDLVLERIACYDGPFLEDGTDGEVVQVTAAVIHNAGEKGILFARLVLSGQNKKLVFEAETIPPGQSVLVLEQNKSKYKRQSYDLCYAQRVLVEEMWWMPQPPQLEAVGMGSLRVTNTTAHCMKNVWLYYKTYQADPGIFIGGITYKVGIRRLEPGQTLLINPPHYVNGYSRIARIATECD